MYRDDCDCSVNHPDGGSEDAPIGEFQLRAEHEWQEGREEAREGFIALELFISFNNQVKRERERVFVRERERCATKSSTATGSTFALTIAFVFIGTAKEPKKMDARTA